MELSPELLAQQARLIANGVRPLALVGTCQADPGEMLDVVSRLEANAEPGATAFVMDRGDGFAEFGYSGASWALDLFRWATRAENEDIIPREQMHRIRGLLLGYGIDAIRSFEERCGGRLFESPRSQATAGRPETS